MNRLPGDHRRGGRDGDAYGGRARPNINDVLSATTQGVIAEDTLILTRRLLETTDAELIKQFGGSLVGWFGLVICDEVHFLKNVDSLMHRAVEILQAKERTLPHGHPDDQSTHRACRHPAAVLGP